MTNAIKNAEFEVVSEEAVEFAGLTFVDDAQYEFVGGGTATNGY